MGAQIIRHVQHQKASTNPSKLIIDSLDVKRYKQQSKQLLPTSKQKRKCMSKKNERQRHIKQSSKRSSGSSFDQKFAKMKSKAMHRAKKDNFESYKEKLLSVHKESKIKTRKMVEQAFEFKEEEIINSDGNNIHNAEQRVRYDLIPSFIQCKIETRGDEKSFDVPTA